MLSEMAASMVIFFISFHIFFPSPLIAPLAPKRRKKEEDLILALDPAI